MKCLFDMEKIFSVDRFEGEYAIVVCDDGGVLEIKREIISGLAERDVFSAIEKNGELCEIVPLPEERERRLLSAKRRLDRFKNKSNS